MILLRSIVLLFFVVTTVHAGEGRAMLDRFLTDTQSMSASFTQILKTSDGRLLQESQGDFYLQRPGKFRWNYSKPYPQEIVSDGEYVWVFDVELEQVTVQKQQSGHNTPMALLQDGASVDSAFEVIEKGSDAGIYRLEMINRVPDSDFGKVTVGVDEKGLRYIELYDQFEQTTFIRFTGLKSNPGLDAGLFDFKPPEGVDVFGGS